MAGVGLDGGFQFIGVAPVIIHFTLGCSMIHRQNFGIPPLESKPPYLCKRILFIYIYIYRYVYLPGCADIDMCIYLYI